MDRDTARRRLDEAVRKLDDARPAWQEREDYYAGRQRLPFAPEGVNVEYRELQGQALANWLDVAMNAPVQRQRVDNFHTGRGAEQDRAVWRDVWQANRLDSRQRIAYLDSIMHGTGWMGCWPNPANRDQPVIRPESPSVIHSQPDPGDPFTPLWQAKVIEVDEPPSSIILPGQTAATGRKRIGWVYDAESWWRFTRGGRLGPSTWELDGTSELGPASGENPLGECPFEPYRNREDALAQPKPAITPLIPTQDAINTIRFNILLAMQFSAYRQRVIVGYDPVLRDDKGEPLWATDAQGALLRDAQGQRVPLLRPMGRVGVDRAMVFPGEGTKVFDMPESDLGNYVQVLGDFLSDLFGRAQVPPQYLLTRMANLSGDALAGAESTLRSLVTEMQGWNGESNEGLLRKATRARGTGEGADVTAEVQWAEVEARPFGQVVDGIVKLVTTGLALRSGLEFLPGATPQKIDRWMDESRTERDELAAAGADDLTRATRALSDATRRPGSGAALAVPNAPSPDAPA